MNNQQDEPLFVEQLLKCKEMLESSVSPITFSSLSSTFSSLQIPTSSLPLFRLFTTSSLFSTATLAHFKVFCNDLEVGNENQMLPIDKSLYKLDDKDTILSFSCTFNPVHTFQVPILGFSNFYNIANQQQQDNIQAIVQLQQQNEKQDNEDKCNILNQFQNQNQKIEPFSMQVSCSSLVLYFKQKRNLTYKLFEIELQRHVSWSVPNKTNNNDKNTASSLLFSAEKINKYSSFKFNCNSTSTASSNDAVSNSLVSSSSQPALVTVENVNVYKLLKSYSDCNVIYISENTKTRNKVSNFASRDSILKRRAERAQLYKQANSVHSNLHKLLSKQLMCNATVKLGFELFQKKEEIENNNYSTEFYFLSPCIVLDHFSVNQNEESPTITLNNEQVLIHSIELTSKPSITFKCTSVAHVHDKFLQYKLQLQFPSVQPLLVQEKSSFDNDNNTCHCNFVSVFKTLAPVIKPVQYPPIETIPRMFQENMDSFTCTGPVWLKPSKKEEYSMVQGEENENKQEEDQQLLRLCSKFDFS